MKVTIYSKEGCDYCDHAVKLCESENLEYEKITVDKEDDEKLAFEYIEDKTKKSKKKKPGKPEQVD